MAHLLAGLNKQPELSPQQTKTLALLQDTVISQSLVMCLNSCSLPTLWVSLESVILTSQ